MNCRRSSASCNRPTNSSNKKPSSSPSATSKSSARIRKSSRRAGRWKKRLPSSRSRPSINLNSWPICRHELRTPLNSILILGQQLTDNPEGNLTGKQVEFARTIHGAGTDLLNLISDILDLSKIESGTVTVDAGRDLLLQSVSIWSQRPFRHEAESRQLSFDAHLDPNLGRTITTNSKRLQQVLKNLLSNAFKFTGQGGVRLSASAAVGGWTTSHPILSQASQVVAFEVSDTGIGIPLEKQKIIFEAFQQADASTSRKYGGTGLGLAISRELTTLLGGEIHLRSAPNSGSSFTLYLPIKYMGTTMVPRSGPASFMPTAPVTIERVEQIADDRLDIQPGDNILLVVEDDPHYARILIDLARDKGFKVLLAMRGDDALDLAKQYQPTAVSLDVFLPDMLGWNVLSQLKQNPLTRHIPVQIVTLDEDRQHGLARGAFSFVTKPTTREGISEALAKIKDFSQSRRRRLLVVEDNKAEQMSIRALLDHDDIEIVNAGTGKEALDILRRDGCDCVVLDLRLPDMSGFEVLESMRSEQALADVPVVVFTGRECRPMRTRSCTRWRAASWSRGSSCRNGCSTRRRCSCTACSAICRWKSSACWSGSTARMRIWSAVPCFWSMTTRAISLRCRARSSAAACMS